MTRITAHAQMISLEYRLRTMAPDEAVEEHTVAEPMSTLDTLWALRAKQSRRPIDTSKPVAFIYRLRCESIGLKHRPRARKEP